MKVALFGVGLMGYPMSERLVKNGHALYVYNRTLSKALPLKEFGVEVLEKPEAALSRAECLILMLTDFPAIQETLALSGKMSFQNKTVIQMGTIAPSESLSLQKEVCEAGGDYFECPVLGSRKEAQNGELILMVGGSGQQFEEWQEFLKGLGPRPRLIGPVGAAAALKLALNQLIASLATTFSLSLAFVLRSGVDPKVFMEILRESALYARMFDKKSERMLQRDYTDPNFSAQHLLKDVELFLKEGQKHGLALEHVKGIREILIRTVALGLGGGDYSSLHSAVMPREN